MQFELELADGEAVKKTFRLCIFSTCLLAPYAAARDQELPAALRQTLEHPYLVLEIEPPAEILEAARSGHTLSGAAVKSLLKREKSLVLAGQKLEVSYDFEYLPLLLVRPMAASELRSLEEVPGVGSVHEPNFYETALSATLSSDQLQVGQLNSMGHSGAGVSVLVTDSGESSTAPTNIHPDFGVCTSVGLPAETCQLASYTVYDPAGTDPHGTNVAAIVARTARSARIHFFDVGCAGTCIDGTLAMQALNWAVQNRDAYNIVAHNMSWGGSFSCNYYDGAFATAVSVGIAQIAASGNQGYASAIFSPACSPFVTSVGNVKSWQTNSNTPAAIEDWEVNPSSNVSPSLDLLAPGTCIGAGGFGCYTGTSQASPHVAGVFAILQAADMWNRIPPADIESIVKETGYAFLDTRVGQSFPVPQIMRARKLTLAISNPLGVTYSISPPATRSCGPDCYEHPQRELSVSLPADFFLTGCRRTSPTTCTISLNASRNAKIFPLRTIISLLVSTALSENIFGDGFE